MIKNIYTLYIWFALALTIFGCKKESFPSLLSTIPQTNILADSDYDKTVEEIAFALYQSLDDKQFSRTLKDEIISRSDGDYEVILKSFVSKHIDLDNSILSLSLMNNDAKGPDFKYPKLQMAIPVNAEKWDGASKLWVLYLPSNYDESSTKEVPAISPEGEKTMFNVEKQPDFPVIVIGQNERSNENGDLKYSFNLLREKVRFNTLAPQTKDGGGFTSFTATPVSNAMAVSLNWTFTYPDYLEPYDHYFEIYRDDLLGGGFHKIGEADSWSSFYYDTDVLPTRTYAYYAVARVDVYQTYNRSDYEEFFYSAADDAAIAQIPTFTSNLAVECIAPNTMKLTWTINNVSNWTNLRIERYTAYNPTPVIVAELPITAISYQDNLINPYPSYSVSYRYNLIVYNINNGAEQAYYCDEMLSNRISNQALKITHIKFNSFDDMRRYESWTRGAPEIRLTVHHGTTARIKDNVLIGGPASIGFYVNPAFQICEWSKTDPQVLTISLNEEDEGDSNGMEVTVGVSAKTPKLFGTEITLSFNLKGTIFKRNNDDFIGSGFLYWWNNADGKDVQCGNYCKATLMSVQE